MLRANGAISVEHHLCINVKVFYLLVDIHQIGLLEAMLMRLQAAERLQSEQVDFIRDELVPQRNFIAAHVDALQCLTAQVNHQLIFTQVASFATFENEPFAGLDDGSKLFSHPFFFDAKRQPKPTSLILTSPRLSNRKRLPPAIVKIEE